MAARDLIYCPVCGTTLTEKVEGGRPRKACPQCGYIHYTNPVPAVGIVIEMDGGIVLIRRNNPPHMGRWALPSGYIEADESAEDAAVREAAEETGLRVEIIELAGVNSFPEGPPLSGIMIFYRVRPIGGELRAGDDAGEARVFLPEELPLLPFRTHREMIAQWLAHFAPRTTTYNGGVTPADSAVEQLGVGSDAEGDEPFDIRPAEAGDANEIMALLSLIPANRSLTREQWRDVYLRFREQAGLEVFVAVTRQAPRMIIGFIALSVIRALTESRTLINDMAVLPTYQRRGVGAALLEAVFKRAERLNANMIIVNTERANDRAAAFYAASGFAQANFMEIRLRSQRPGQ